MNKRIALLLAFLMAAPAFAQTPQAAQPSRSDIITAAKDVMAKARYCTFVTNGEDGHPQARIIDPLAPDSAFTIWFATNPLTRKVDQIRKDPRVTLLCFDSGTSSYVTVLGRGTLITEPPEKQAHWKPEWARIYPNGANSSDVMLVRVTPMHLEIVSSARGMRSDPKTWLPLSIDFPPK